MPGWHTLLATNRVQTPHLRKNLMLVRVNRHHMAPHAGAGQQHRLLAHMPPKMDVQHRPQPPHIPQEGAHLPPFVAKRPFLTPIALPPWLFLKKLHIDQVTRVLMGHLHARAFLPLQRDRHQNLRHRRHPAQYPQEIKQKVPQHRGEKSQIGMMRIFQKAIPITRK